MTYHTTTLSSCKEEQTSDYLSTWFQILGGSLFIALCAQIKVPLFFSPIPLSLQTLAVMLVAGFLGRSKGSLAVMAYLAQMSMGLPVGVGGAIAPLALIGASGGYLVGFVMQAYLVGLCADNRHRMGNLAFFAALSVISMMQLGLGTLWLGASVGMQNALFMGFLPFVAGELLKVAAAAPLIAKWRS